MENESRKAELDVTEAEARRVADLLRYAVSLNTTAGLVSPERRLTPSTYRAIELAALILEGESFEKAVEESENRWSGALQSDHERALDLLQTNRESLTKAMAGALSPEKAARYLEIEREQLLELVRFPGPQNPGKPEKM